MNDFEEDAKRYRWLRDEATAQQWRQVADCPPGHTDSKIDELMFAAGSVSWTRREEERK